MSTVHVWWPTGAPENASAAVYDCTVVEAWQAIVAEGTAGGHTTTLVSTTRPIDGGPPVEIHGSMIVDVEGGPPMAWEHLVARPTSGWGVWVDKVKDGTSGG